MTETARTLSRQAMLFPAALAAAFAVAGCGVQVQLGFDECTYDGTVHQAGDSFPSTDGCNTCSCASDGSVECTLMGCAPACEYAGQLYQSGATFPASDGCNTCSCGMDGSVSCTEIACNCMTPVICPAPSGCHFEGGDCNSCGDLVCDCQGDPSMIDCPMPPTGCQYDPPTCVMGQWECGQLQCGCGGCDVVACDMGYTCEPDQNACGVCVPSGQLGCVYSNEYHPIGDMFPAGDGCNNCVCDMSGMIECTQLDCQCAPCSAMLCGSSTCTEDMNGCGQCGEQCTSCSALMCTDCTEDMNGCGQCGMQCPSCSDLMCTNCTEDMNGCGQCGQQCTPCAGLMCPGMGCVQDAMGCGTCAPTPGM